MAGECHAWYQFQLQIEPFTVITWIRLPFLARFMAFLSFLSASTPAAALSRLSISL